MSEKRPLFRFAIKKNINVSNYEKLTVGKFFNFKDHFSEDRKFRKSQILKFLKSNNKNFEKEKKYFAEKFYSKKDPINFEIYAKHQKPNKLPKKWSSKEKNIVFFTSSDDEHLSFGKDMNPTFYEQREILKETSLIINKKKNFKLWIRVHPGWRNEKWFDRKFYQVLEKKYKNVNVIYPEDNTSSYAMLKNSFNVICFWSSLLVEATYWREKKSISLTRNDIN